MKAQYTEPAIYTGGVDIAQWSKLSAKEQKAALAKAWYVRFSFRHPETWKMARQTNIKGGANEYKTQKERYQYLQDLRRNLSYLLAKGFDPYRDNTELKNELLDRWEVKAARKAKKDKSSAPKTPTFEFKTPVREALEKGLHLKSLVQAPTSQARFRSRINQFHKWILRKGFKNSDPIEMVTKKVVLDYLNQVLEDTSARNRNNTRTDLSSLFQVLLENEIVGHNPVKETKVVKSKPTRNRTYTRQTMERLHEYMAMHHPILDLFSKFIGYAHLRPIEICRLKVRDVDVDNKRIHVQTKTKLLEHRLLLQILIDELPDLASMDPNAWLFTPEGFGMDWEATDESKRGYFSKTFKEVKDHFGLDENYGLYSIRHTYITQVYTNLRKEHGPREALVRLMDITWHDTEKALKSYLRDIGAEFLDDYSHLYD